MDAKNMEDMATVVDSLTEATHALRRAIRRGADEVGQLEQFEERFRNTETKFQQFKELAHRNDKQAFALLSRLDQQVIRQRQSADILRKQIEQLKRAIAHQAAENEKLDSETKASVDELIKAKERNTFMKSPPPFIQRLNNDQL